MTSTTRLERPLVALPWPRLTCQGSRDWAGTVLGLEGARWAIHPAGIDTERFSPVTAVADAAEGLYQRSRPESTGLDGREAEERKECERRDAVLVYDKYWGPGLKVRATAAFSQSPGPLHFTTPAHDLLPCKIANG